MKKYLFSKIFKVFVLTSLLFFILFSIFLVQTFKKIYFLNIEKEHKDFIYKICHEINNKIEKEKTNLNDELKKIDRYTNIRITLLKLDGSVIFDSREKPELMENHKNRPEIIEAIKKGEGKSIRLSPTLNKNMFYYAVFMREKDIIVRTSLEMGYIQKVFSKFKQRFFIFIFSTYLIFIFIFFFVLFLSLKEISVIDSFISNLSKKVYGLKILSLKSKGLKKVIEDLNSISENLLLSSETGKLENEVFKIIELIEEPVAFIDSEGELITYNKFFEKFLKILPENKYYWEVIEKFSINEYIEKTINLKCGFEKELEIDEKWYFLKTKYIEDKKMVLVILFDITAFKEIEKIRKDFITNISHELKTPLTIIKGYVETLEEETEKPEIKNYLSIIKVQTEKLIKIVENIINSYQLELKKIDFEEINIYEVIKNVYNLFEKKAKEKNIVFLLNYSDVPPTKGDKFKIEQAIMNLVDNAFKFTEKGEIKINLYQKEKYIVIEVVDTGIGISEEELPKIFDKFYVGKKKKPNTGTGLGLSIVKNIIDLHNGHIEVESKVGEGTKFTISFPI